MKLRIFLFAALALLLSSPAMAQLGSMQLGMDINKKGSPWPTDLGVKFDVWRTLGAQVEWRDIQPVSPRDYYWAQFDYYADRAVRNGQAILYTVYETPGWANGNEGNQFPPSDVDSTDAQLITFVTAVFKHAKSTGHRIQYWECWNEPNNMKEFGGTTSQLVRMCTDLYKTVHSLDPQAQVLTPPFMSWLRKPNTGVDLSPQFVKYLRAGGAAAADIIAFHLYIYSDPTEVPPAGRSLGAHVAKTIANFADAAKEGGMGGKPLWSTEGNDVGLKAADNETAGALTARYLLQAQGRGLAELTWFGWDYGWDNNVSYILINAPGKPWAKLKPSGLAWKQVVTWGPVTEPCTAKGTVYTCGFADGKVAMWDSSQTCEGSGSCTTQDAILPARYKGWIDLSGARHVTSPVTTSTVTVPLGAKPILLGEK
jgi:polysaccharide biosynthesis protein PslG